VLYNNVNKTVLRFVAPVTVFINGEFHVNVQKSVKLNYLRLLVGAEKERKFFVRLALASNTTLFVTCDIVYLTYQIIISHYLSSPY